MTEEDVTKMGPLTEEWYRRILRLLYDHPALGPRGNEFIVFIEHMRNIVQAYGRARALGLQGKNEEAGLALREAEADFEAIPKWVMEDFENGNHNERRSGLQGQIRH